MQLWKTWHSWMRPQIVLWVTHSCLFSGKQAHSRISVFSDHSRGHDDINDLFLYHPQYLNLDKVSTYSSFCDYSSHNWQRCSKAPAGTKSSSQSYSTGGLHIQKPNYRVCWMLMLTLTLMELSKSWGSMNLCFKWLLPGDLSWGFHQKCPSLHVWDFLSHRPVYQH